MDTTNLIIAATSIITAAGLIWNFFIRKKFKIIINYQNSFIGIKDGNYFAIISVNLINETSNEINDLKITTPNYKILSKIINPARSESFTNGGHRVTTFFPPTNPIDNVINVDKTINISTSSNLEGNLIIDIESDKNEIKYIEFSFLTKKIKQKINFKELKTKLI
jgi:hypothetical protein